MSFSIWRDRLVLLIIALLPWQARYIKELAALGDAPWEQGTVSLFAVEALMLAALACHFLAGSAACPAKSAGGGSASGGKTETPMSFQLWALILAFALVSVFWGADTLTGLFTWLRLFDGFALAWLIWMSNLSLRRCLAAFLVGGVFAAAVGVIQFFSQTAPASTWLGMAAHDAAEAGTAVIETAGGRFLRAYGTLPHPNVFGGFMAVAMLASLALAVDTEQKKRRAVFMALSGVFTIGLIVSFSRSAWMGYAAALLLIIMFGWARRRPEDRPRFKKAVFIQCAVAAIMLALVWPLAATRVSAAGRLETQSFSDRRVILGQAVELFKRHYAVGTGLGNMVPAAYQELPYEGDDYLYQPVHVVPALVAVELGFFGIAALLAAAWAWASEARLLFRTARRSLIQFAAIAPVILGVVAFFDHYLLTQLAGTMLSGFVLGVFYKAQDTVGN